MILYRVSKYMYSVFDLFRLVTSGRMSGSLNSAWGISRIFTHTAPHEDEHACMILRTLPATSEGFRSFGMWPANLFSPHWLLKGADRYFKNSITGSYDFHIFVIT